MERVETEMIGKRCKVMFLDMETRRINVSQGILLSISPEWLVIRDIEHNIVKMINCNQIQHVEVLEKI